MKKSIILSTIILILFSSCSRYINTGGGGCGVWMPKKFGNDRAHMRKMNWVKNPNSARYKTGVH
jgi:hypothetical protein